MTELPTPLTPADCDLQDFAFMPLDVGRLRDSDLASDETPEACWAAVLIWAASWHQIPAASIPNNDNWIAKQAGYAQRGKIDKDWTAVRKGALHGWVECQDGRLYHPVVAEKAVDAWKSKMEQRWKSECGRIKKHNQRHGTKVPTLDFDEWTRAGRPQGHPLPVPKDKPDEFEDNYGDSDSKGQGEGQRQGQGQLTSKPNTGNNAHASTAVAGQNDLGVCHSVGEISIVMRGYGINANPGDLRMVELASQGVSLATVHAACQAAKEKKPNEAIPAAFVIGFIRNWKKDADEMSVRGARPPTSKQDSRAAAAASIGLGARQNVEYTIDPNE